MQWYEVIIRLGLAVLFGLIIGFERERRHRPAGVKTHVLVCMGAALVSLIQIYMIDEALSMIAADSNLASAIKSDSGRMGAQVISGIGFLGAGTIMKTKGSIQGLTTASTVWLIGCVGLAVGMGYYYISAVTMAFIVLGMAGINLVQKAVQNSKGQKKVDITLMKKKDTMCLIEDYCVVRNIQIKNVVYVTPSDNQEMPENTENLFFTYEYSLILPRTMIVKTLIKDLQMEDNVVSVVESAGL